MQRKVEMVESTLFSRLKEVVSKETQYWGDRGWQVERIDQMGPEQAAIHFIKP